MLPWRNKQILEKIIHTTSNSEQNRKHDIFTSNWKRHISAFQGSYLPVPSWRGFCCVVSEEIFKQDKLAAGDRHWQKLITRDQRTAVLTQNSWAKKKFSIFFLVHVLEFISLLNCIDMELSSLWLVMWPFGITSCDHSGRPLKLVCKVPLMTSMWPLWKVTHAMSPLQLRCDHYGLWPPWLWDVTTDWCDHGHWCVTTI